MDNNKHITSSSTGLRNIGTFAAKTRSKGANITTRGEMGVRCQQGVRMKQTQRAMALSLTTNVATAGFRDGKQIYKWRLEYENRNGS